MRTDNKVSDAFSVAQLISLWDHVNDAKTWRFDGPTECGRSAFYFWGSNFAEDSHGLEMVVG